MSDAKSIHDKIGQTVVNVGALIARSAYVHVPDIMKAPLEKEYKKLENIYRITGVVKDDGSDRMPDDVSTVKVRLFMRVNRTIINIQTYM